jgi:hypothetical protein
VSVRARSGIVSLLEMASEGFRGHFHIGTIPQDGRLSRPRNVTRIALTPRTGLAPTSPMPDRIVAIRARRPLADRIITVLVGLPPHIGGHTAHRFDKRIHVTSPKAEGPPFAAMNAASLASYGAHGWKPSCMKHSAPMAFCVSTEKFHAPSIMA